MITVDQITTPVTEEQALQTCINELTALGFSASSWQSGSRSRFMLQLLAKLYSQVTVTVADIASAGFNSSAARAWLTLFSDSHYDNQRFAAVTTQGTLVLTSAANTPGPQSITIGQLVFADSVYGYTYRNTTAFTLNPSSTHSVPVQAETAAGNRDVSTGTITQLKTSIVGCTVNNPAIGITGTWITRNGADEETDAALSLRNTNKWGTLGIGPGMAYAYNAAMGHASVRRVFVDDANPRGPGTVDVYLATDSGTVVAGVVTAVAEYFDGTFDGVDRVNTSADLLVLSAVALPVTVQAAVYILAQHNTAATQATIEAAVNAYFTALPIGGTKLTEGGTGSVCIGSLFGAMIPVAGVQNVTFSAPTADLAMARNEVAVPTLDFTYYPV